MMNPTVIFWMEYATKNKKSLKATKFCILKTVSNRMKDFSQKSINSSVHICHARDKRLKIEDINH